jgi:V/A-type H+/Na+-transporting ATPase subunit I
MHNLEMTDEGSPSTDHEDGLVDTDELAPQLDRYEKEADQACEHLDGEKSKLEKLESTLSQLEPLAGIDIDMGTLQNPRFVYSVLGVIPNDNIERLQTSLGRIPVVFLKLRQESRTSVVWLAGPKNNEDILERAVRSSYLNPINLPDSSQGKPSEIIDRLHKEIAETRECIVEQEKAVAQLREAHKRQLQEILWKVRASRLLANAIGHFGKLQYTYIIVGWVPASRLPGLTDKLKQASKDIVVETFPLPRGKSRQDVPVALNNPRVTQPFQMLVTTYARPRYYEVDPTILMAITFPLLFGAMFGDVGQGALLVLLGLLINSRRVKALRSLAGLGKLITYCGLSATVFGFLYGSIFGIETLLPALWIKPLENILQILIIAVAAGVVFLSLGFLLGILNAAMARDWGHLLFDSHGVAGLLLYWSLLGVVIELALNRLVIPIGVLLALAAIGGAGIALSEPLKRLVEGHRPLIEGGIGTFVIQAFFELFEALISLLSNSLSYVRVGAFAVAHGGLNSVIFILAEMVSPGHGIGYWIVFALGTLFIVGFEGLIVGIQTMRLSYYEFFSKFFTGGGTRYEPLTLSPTQKE